MGFLDLILPRTCLSCPGELPPPSGPVCRPCARLLLARRFPTPPGGGSPGRCPRCFARLADEPCSFCCGRYVFFARHQSLFAWSDHWRSALHAWKFLGERRALRMFGKSLLSAAGPPEQFDLIAWIRPSSVSADGPCYDPMRDLAGLLRASWVTKFGNSPPAREVLRKQRRGRQSKRAFSDRFWQIVGGFEVVGEPVRGLRVLLLEDLFTTGATANEASRLLREAGAIEVRVISMVMREELDFSRGRSIIT